MRVYIAAPFANKTAAKTARLNVNGMPRLRAVGTWMDDRHTSDADATESAKRDGAALCAREVRECDALLLLEDGSPGSGRHVEVGMALALGKPVVVVGAPTGAFYALSEVLVVATLAEAIAALRGMALREPA